MTGTTTSPTVSDAVPLPSLSDEAAVEIYLFIEHVFLMFESRYGDQIRRHFEDISEHNLIGPEFDSPMDDPPF